MDDLITPRRPGAPYLLTFEPPAWPGHQLRLWIKSNAILLCGAGVLGLLGKPASNYGRTYDSTPAEHLRRISRRVTKIGGQGPARTRWVTLEGARRWVRLAFAAERRAGEGTAAAAFEDYLVSTVLPQIDGGLDLWAATGLPLAPDETDAAKLARLDAIMQEPMAVRTFMTAKGLDASPGAVRTFGRWCAAQCEAEGFAYARGVGTISGTYPRKVLEAGLRCGILGAS